MSRFVFACACFVLGAALVVGDEPTPNGGPKEGKGDKGKGKGKDDKAQPPQAPNVQTLKDAITAFTAATAKKDTTAAEKFLAADFVWVTESGEVLDTKLWAERVKKQPVVRVPSTAPKPAGLAATIESAKLTGTTGVVVGLWAVTDEHGYRYWSRFTLTAAASGSSWKIAAVQVADVNAAPAVRDLKDAVEAFAAAVANKDITKAWDYLAPDFTWVTVSGEVLDRDAWSARVNKNQVVRVPATEPKFKEFAVSFQSAKVTNGTGVVVGTWVTTDERGNGYRTRFTLTGAAEPGGDWKIVAVQVAESK